MTDKRTRASRDKIEKVLAAALANGLIPTSISYHPDGGFTVHFDDVPAKVKPGTGWEDI